MDAPVHDSIEELATIASDRTQWRLYVEELAGNDTFQMQKANTAAKTAAEIEAKRSPLRGTTVVPKRVTIVRSRPT